MRCLCLGPRGAAFSSGDPALQGTQNVGAAGGDRGLPCHGVHQCTNTPWLGRRMPVGGKDKHGVLGWVSGLWWWGCVPWGHTPNWGTGWRGVGNEDMGHHCVTTSLSQLCHPMSLPLLCHPVSLPLLCHPVAPSPRYCSLAPSHPCHPPTPTPRWQRHPAGPAQRCWPRPRSADPASRDINTSGADPAPRHRPRPQGTDPAPKDTYPALRGRCFRRRPRPAASDAFSRSRRRGPCQPWRTPAGAARSPSATCSSW